MLPLIPTPTVLTQSGPGFTLESGMAVGVDPSLAGVARPFLTGLLDDHELRLELSDGPAAVTLELVADDQDLAALPHASGVRADDLAPDAERYGLEITAEGARIWAGAPAGLHRGLTTLRQLLINGPELPGVRILDAPRYAWRGLNLDVVRTFFEPDAVRRVIDLLDSYKFNVLHLHLTDDQGWRLEIDGWPELTSVGAQGAYDGRPGGFYTIEDYHDIVAYAAERFITVVPEFDLPGHSTALIRSYPEFGTVDQVGGLSRSQLDADQPRLWELITDVLGQYAALTPGRFLHLGGDEGFGLSDDFHADFLDRAIGIVHGLGKRVVGWQEAARAGLGDGDIAQYWIDFTDRLEAMFEGRQDDLARQLVELFGKADDDLGRAVGQGAGILFSPVGFCYLDRPYDDPPGEDQQELWQRLGLRQAYPPVTIEDAFGFDPDLALAEVAPGAVISGVEATVWCETVTSESDLQFLLLPRLPGIAERAWAPAGTSWAEFLPRLAAHRELWATRGYTWFDPAELAGPATVTS
ncbi:beta-N-acetylhexosaminidase [Microlunatus sp. Gsoil 973]|uniref:beta-N-acetylhexosaminidase n=1 Tax=Microlunatus sp. Gsoil 973 TaxID=2672569 RepID=UPI0012B4E2CE|nr:family 20 glycosylhydrolase [Microlunatus sp. Gsoil 973]QGN33343.1 family 20 glycosylhydrolase [Microlunatus sp. Gsoil 973]